MNMKNLTIVSTLVLGSLAVQSASAAIALDRTRVVYNGSDKSLTLSIENKNNVLPYLAQAWLEDISGNKVSSPVIALPPIQRVEPGTKSQIKLQGITSALNALPQDRESVYYFNLREIPPRTNKANTLQLALQTRIKLFYRPTALAVSNTDKPFQEKVTLTRSGNVYTVNNPTPYYVTIINAANNTKALPGNSFKPFMVPPKGQAPIGVNADAIGSSPVLTYINDFGGRPKLIFKCNGATCSVASSTKG
ncbi:fimbria/pilus periplasmic chaperone [Buttiauxella sp. B2]|uniref:fimbria/pilus periplasmic chaperone n=1 Tax=Buttiauxella sp. B2 TaxID=2587812 RepID=UPI00268D61E2|nr:fimbria/pilus periplasmic chaperone [Buttiauxella sp. B2]